MADIDEFFEKMKSIQINLIDFFEKDDDIEENCENFIKILSDYQILFNDLDKFKLTLKLISKIAKNHNRDQNFLEKIYKILIYMKDEIKDNFSNSEIFEIFKGNKIILLFLFQMDILTMDQHIYKIITGNDKYKRMKYPEYFNSEIKKFLNKPIENNKTKNYEENRRIGENETHICKLIRNDSLDEFIEYVYKNDIPLQSTIDASTFETNSILMRNSPSLLEYSAFFGSIKIFKYLILNKVEVSSNIWFYAIHSNKEALICYLKDIKIEPENYEKILEESIKCHHNGISNYILKICFDKKEKANFDENAFAYSFHYHNYSFFPVDTNYEFIFYYACQFNYLNIVKGILQSKKININDTII